MSFIHSNWIPAAVALYIIWLVVWFYDKHRFQKWLSDSFGLKSSFTNSLRRVFFVLSVGCIMLALLDLRGPEQQVDTPLSDQKTIVLIDTSASMLVEDVQPNRFKRALTVARHFVKNAVGHQISIVLFSDISKRLVPFTDDIDLLDARLAGLEDEQLRGGGSNISSALAETVEALKHETSNGKPGGNILLITDAEENGEQFKVENADGISLAVIGIGTVSGGKIPMRTKKGTFSGYKTHGEKEVISKLDEQYLDKLTKLFPRGKKWVVLSFSMPTEEVLTFFREGANTAQTVDQNKIRPVRSQWLVGLGLALYILSILLGQVRNYVTIMLIFLAFFFRPAQSFAMEKSSVDIQQLQHNWSHEKKQNLALEFAKAKEMDKASLLYSEAKNNLSTKAKANWGTTLLAQGKPEGLEVLNEALKENAGKDVELDRTIYANVKKYFTEQKNNKGKNGKKSEKDKKDKGKSKGKGNGNSGGKDQKQNKSSKGDGKDDRDKSKDQKDEQKDGEGKEKQENRRITNMAQREREIDRKRRMMKVPALLKQLMQDDRALQSEFIDTATQDRQQTREKKDW